MDTTTEDMATTVSLTSGGQTRTVVLDGHGIEDAAAAIGSLTLAEVGVVLMGLSLGVWACRLWMVLPWG